MFGPDNFGGIRGSDGEITALGGAKVGIIARWQIRREGTRPDGGPRLTFKAWFSWKNDALMNMCRRGDMKGRVRVFMLGKNGREQIDIVNWDEWQQNEDGMLTLSNVLHFDTAPLHEIRGSAK